MHAPKTWLKQIIVDIDTSSVDALTGYRTLDVESNRNGCMAVHKDDDGDDDAPAASTCLRFSVYFVAKRYILKQKFLKT